MGKLTGGNPKSGSNKESPSNKPFETIEQAEAEFQSLPPTENIYSVTQLEKSKNFMTNLDELQRKIYKDKEVNDKKINALQEKGEQLNQEIAALDGRLAFAEEAKNQEEIKRLEEIKAAKEKELQEQEQRNIMEKDLRDKLKAQEEKIKALYADAMAKDKLAEEKRKGYLEKIAGSRVSVLEMITNIGDKALGEMAKQDDNARDKRGVEKTINENIRRALLNMKTEGIDQNKMNEIVTKTISKMRDIQDMSEEEVYNEMREKAGSDAGSITRDMAKQALSTAKRTKIQANLIGDFSKGDKFSALAGSTVGKVVGASSGAEVGSALFSGAKMFMGPLGALIADAVAAIFSRMNQIGKEGKELYEKTAGRYGYGEGFDERTARGFLKFSGNARMMASEYAKNAEDVKKVFAEMSEYVGVRSLDQMEGLARSTMMVANATGLATGEVAKLGGSYQKFFGMDAQKAAMTSGKQLLGLMTDINRGMSANLMLTNSQIAGLMQKMLEAGEGADVSKTLIPFIGTAQEQLKGLGIQSAFVRDRLNESMLNIKATGAGLPKSLAMFMLGTGNLFSKNTLTGSEQQVANQVGKGKFAYEAAGEMATRTTGPAQKFWSSDKLKSKEGLADLAFKLKGGNLASLLASQSDDQLGNITKAVFELFQIEGAEQALGVSLSQITKEFADIARKDKVKFKAMGGDLDSVVAMDQFAKAQKLVQTGRNEDGSMATDKQLAEAAQNMKDYSNKMTPQDMANRFLEKLVGSVDLILAFLMKIPFPGGGELKKQTYGNLGESEYNEMLALQNNINKSQEEAARLKVLQNKQYAKATSKVDSTTGGQTTTVTTDDGAGETQVKAGIAYMNNKPSPG